MPLPLIPGLFVAGGINQVGPMLGELAIQRGSEINDPASVANRSVEATQKANRLIESMKENARAIQLLKKGE